MTPLKAIVSSLAVMLLVGACGEPTTSSPDVKITANEQNTWKQLTSDADAALKKGDKAGAEQGYKAAISEAEKLGADNLAQEETTANLANFYYAQGDGGQADQLYKKNLAVREKRLGMEHVDLTVDLLKLAKVSSSQKNYAEASAYYERAIAILKKAGQAVPPEVEAGYVNAQKLSTSKSK